jgi:hypothetical protein
VFSVAPNLLALRGEDHSKRRANSTDYLLGGLITCGRFGKLQRDGSAWQAPSRRRNLVTPSFSGYPFRALKVLKWIGSAILLLGFAVVMLYCNGYFTCKPDPDPNSHSCTYGAP